MNIARAFCATATALLACSRRCRRGGLSFRRPGPIVLDTDVTVGQNPDAARRSAADGHHRLKPTAVLAVVGLTALVLLGACGDDGDTGARSTTNSMRSAEPAITTSPGRPSGIEAVTIAEFLFTPSTVTVPAGGTVTWTNNDEVAHSISDTSPMAKPESKSLNKGDTFSITYPEPGTYPYVCGIHNYMQGSVEVKG